MSLTSDIHDKIKQLLRCQTELDKTENKLARQRDEIKDLKRTLEPELPYDQPIAVRIGKILWQVTKPLRSDTREIIETQQMTVIA